jgi:hypothetical protein
MNKRQSITPWIWYYVSGGRQHGPVSMTDLGDILRRGEIGLDALVWTPGMAAWRAGSDIAAVRELAVQLGVAPPPLPVDPELSRASSHTAPPIPLSDTAFTVGGKGPPTVVRSEAHPWRRWFARMIDAFVAAFVLGVAMTMLGIGAELRRNEIGMSMATVLFMIPFDATCIALWQQTAGKALLNIHVLRQDGRPESWLSAARRTGNVAVFGMAVGFPFVSLFTLYHQYRQLTKAGTTSYDREHGYLVTHGPVTGGRLVALLMFLALVAWLIALGAR